MDSLSHQRELVTLQAMQVSPTNYFERNIRLQLWRWMSIQHRICIANANANANL